MLDTAIVSCANCTTLCAPVQPSELTVPHLVVSFPGKFFQNTPHALGTTVAQPTGQENRSKTNT
jgi:hypothetical protein